MTKVAGELNISPRNVAAVAQLLAEGATVPFIARYRKEATGSLDEVAITAIRDRTQQLAELEARRGSILNSLQERNLLTPELQKKIAGAETMTVLEDLFAPYRPKRRTRATIAKEKGLEPLAEWLLANQATANMIKLSPDGSRAFAEVQGKHYLITVPKAGRETITVSVTGSAMSLE